VATTYADARSKRVRRDLRLSGGTSCGILRKVSGGAIVADVVTEKVALTRDKHWARVRYEEFELDVGFAMGNRSSMDQRDWQRNPPAG